MIWHKVKKGKQVPADTDLYMCFEDYSVRIGYFRSKDGQGFCYGITDINKANAIYWARMKYPPKYFYHKIKRLWFIILIYIVKKLKITVDK